MREADAMRETDAPAGTAATLDGAATDPEASPAEAGDARLVELARQGDDDAFAALVVRYERKLLRVLVRLVRDPEQARDLAQETFWKVYNRLDRFDTARRFGPWLFQIGVNLALDQLRRRSGPPPGTLSLDHSAGNSRGGFDVPDADPRLQAELAQEVQFLLGRLPPPYRTVLVLRDLEGFSSAEVAAIVQKREATVRWRLAKAREMFREHWERRESGATASRPVAWGEGDDDDGS
jgi:RNA polymerase sigma-70 factor (ECF subfamily)